jgi:hypothetical protein
MAEPERPQPLKTPLSVLIALTALTGALVSWQASRVGSAASSADSKAITAALDEAATEMGISAETFSNLTNAREYLVHMENGRALREESARDPGAGGRLIEEWRAESIRARARHTQLNQDYIKTDEGRPTFDSERYRETVRALAASEKPLAVEPFIKTSNERRRESLLLASLNALFAAAIFLFTVALKTEVRAKPVWAAAGLVLYLTAAAIAALRIFG